MRRSRAICVLCIAMSFAGCSTRSDKFTLPPGNAERGQEAFVHFRCYDCHRVRGVDLPIGEEPNQVMVELGRVESQPRDYSDLVTAIVNPSHRLAKGYTPVLISTDGKSRMTVYNDVMTVTQLIDIVAFLQSHYEVRPYEPTPYPDFYGP